MADFKGLRAQRRDPIMTPPSVIEIEDAVVDSNPDCTPTPNRAPDSKRADFLQVLIDAKDAILLRIRSRKLTESERRNLHQDMANDPEVQRALERTLAAHPQFRRKAHDRSDTSDRHV